MDYSMVDRDIETAKALIAEAVFVAIRQYEPRAVVESVGFAETQGELLDGKIIPIVTISEITIAR
jgi:phage baseplate assembly protein W